jgi:hypothetical protein
MQLKHVWITGQENRNEVSLKESKKFSSRLIEQHQHMHASNAQLSISVYIRSKLQLHVPVILLLGKEALVPIR